MCTFECVGVSSKQCKTTTLKVQSDRRIRYDKTETTALKMQSKCRITQNTIQKVQQNSRVLDC